MSLVDPFERLHLNVIALVVELLNPVDIVRLQRVNHNWNSILGSEYIARVALLAHFPHSPEAIELVCNNEKGKGKEIQEDESEKPVKRRRKSKLHERKPAPEVVWFRRATFRLHTRALAKPSKVHKYRLHHVSEKSFTATSTHLFWAESNRNIWVQRIGEGVGGRRSLRLRSFGDTAAHLYQIVATEAGLVIVLYREVGSWNLVLMALEHQADRVIWKINPAHIPADLQATSNHVCYTVGVTAQFPHQPSIMPGLRNMDIYIHSLETGMLLHKALLQTPVIGECSVVPGSYIIYPPAKPTKIFATYDVQTRSGACRSVVRVYSIGGEFLHRFDLDRPAIDVSRYRPELSLRFAILPATRRGEPEKLMLVESTSRPYICRPETYMPLDKAQSNNPVLSAWIVNPDTHEVEEIRRYFSTYAENEKVPMMESHRADPLGGEYTRLECLDAIRGISYIYYDENKKNEPVAAEEDQHLNGVQPVRAWYESGCARIDSICYEEQFSREIDTGLPIKQGHFPDLLSSPPPPLGLHYNSTVDLMHTAAQMPWDWRVYIPTSRPYPSPLGSPFHNAKSTETNPEATWKPVVRHFLQSSRHKLVQPDIMRRRRRHNLGEEEEDWQLLPVKTGPMIFMDANSRGGTPNDGRFVFLLAKCSGWSITCFVLDFQPEW